MQLSLSPADLAIYLQRQLATFFPDGDGDSVAEVNRFVGPALERLERCFAPIGAKGFRGPDGPHFHHRHSDQYAIFLYLVGNTAFRLAPGHPMAEKSYLLNKALHAVDIYFEVELPDIFMLVHPVGTVLGRAHYGDFLCAYQNVTVGSNLAGERPAFGEGVVLYGGSRVIGDARIGTNSMVSTSAVIVDLHAGDDVLVFGTSPANIVKPNRRNVKADIFGVT